MLHPEDEAGVVLAPARRVSLPIRAVGSQQLLQLECSRHQWFPSVGHCSAVQSAVAGRGQMHSNRLNGRPSRTCFARRGFHLHRHFFRARRIIARGTARRFDRFDRPARRPAARVVTESGRPRRTDLLDSSDEWEWPNGKKCCPDPDKRLFRCLVSISDKRRQARNWISSKLRRSRVMYRIGIITIRRNLRKFRASRFSRCRVLEFQRLTPTLLEYPVFIGDMEELGGRETLLRCRLI